MLGAGPQQRELIIGTPLTDDRDTDTDEGDAAKEGSTEGDMDGLLTDEGGDAGETLTADTDAGLTFALDDDEIDDESDDESDGAGREDSDEIHNVTVIVAGKMVQPMELKNVNTPPLQFQLPLK